MSGYGTAGLPNNTRLTAEDCKLCLMCHQTCGNVPEAFGGLSPLQVAKLYNNPAFPRVPIMLESANLHLDNCMSALDSYDGWPEAE